MILTKTERVQRNRRSVSTICVNMSVLYPKSIAPANVQARDIFKAVLTVTNIAAG